MQLSGPDFSVSVQFNAQNLVTAMSATWAPTTDRPCQAFAALAAAFICFLYARTSCRLASSVMSATDR